MAMLFRRAVTDQALELELQALELEFQKCSTDEARAVVLHRFLGSAKMPIEEKFRILDPETLTNLVFRGDAPKSTRDPSMLASPERRRW